MNLDGLEREARLALYQAKAALEAGNQDEARSYALKAAQLAPEREEAWLLMASLAEPDHAVAYAQRAVKINPHSERAQKGLDWARSRANHTSEPEESGSHTRGINKQSDWAAALSRMGERISSSLLILLGIAFLTNLGLYLAQRGRDGLPVTFGTTLVDTLTQTFRYIFQHPASYTWHKVTQPAFGVVFDLFTTSAGLLLVSLLLATLVGGLLGTAAALIRQRTLAPMIVFISILGISTPSFLLAMLLWVVNAKLYPLLGLNTALLPPTGFGWDAHLVMPALVLSARPLAQIMQVTYVSLREVMGQEYMRLAKAKGATGGGQLIHHALRNILIPVLTTLGTSLRFSLASLPVVESFFLWPGVGLAILQAIELQMPSLITDLTVSLGLLFLGINLLIEMVYPLIDPRLRKNNHGSDEEEMEWRGSVGSLGEFFDSFWQDLKDIPKAVTGLFSKTPRKKAEQQRKSDSVSLPAEPPNARSKMYLLTAALKNPAFLMGSFMALAFLLLVVFGGQLTPANPYETHNIMMIEGEVFAPPFPPSSIFPWGTDAIGRDIQSLVLNGARQTLSLAFFGMLARVILGVVLGMLAGWWQNSWLDRLVNSLISIWAAFPVTIFALILVLAMGIERGVGVFVVALCVVGWGEIAQFVRGQVIAQRPSLYIEAAKSVGARPTQILFRHILPHLLPSSVVLAVLEMGGILMLLAELGFLNIFLGGGFKAAIAEGARMAPVFYYFSDVPEWSALLANIRAWWRSYPWLAWWPGLFFFLSILTFNLWGDGMRRYLEDTRVNLGKLINRYSVALGMVIVVVMFWGLRGNNPMELYAPIARQFDANRAMLDIEALSSPKLSGRETGLPEAKISADYLAKRMEQIGLFPAGDENSFIQTYNKIYFHYQDEPELALVDEQGGLLQDFAYREDFTEYTSDRAYGGQGVGQLVGLTVGMDESGVDSDSFVLRDYDLDDKVIIVLDSTLSRVDIQKAAGVLVVSSNPDFTQIHDLTPNTSLFSRLRGFPALEISPKLADQLLHGCGSSLDELRMMNKGLPAGEFAHTQAGGWVKMSLLPVEENMGEVHYNVIGFIPGAAAQMQTKDGRNLDNQTIIVSAYYDGVGMGLNGEHYPGANDNASGVAAMLELARLLKESPYPPNKTVVFVAWSGGERMESLSVTNVMGAKRGFDGLTVEAVLELSGLGAGSGKGLFLNQDSSYRLIQVFEEAARRIGVPITTRGRGPHAERLINAAYAGRSALSAYLSWDGSDVNVHTIKDSPQSIDLDKLKMSGETAMLVLEVISRELDY
jgi:ABC-type dipeptide/oligopeptide/nickel transport system permease component